MGLQLPDINGPDWEKNLSTNDIQLLTSYTEYINRLTSLNKSISVVVFWKQNDTTLYGRRHDMVVQYLSSRADIHKVIVIDAPISRARLAEWGKHNGITQHQMVCERTLLKGINALDDGKCRYRVYIHEGQETRKWLPSYMEFLESLFIQEGIDPRTSVFWFYPSNDLAPGIIDHFAPSCVVTDIVDDHRAWPNVNEARKERFTQNYRDILSRSHFAFCNCQPVQTAMREFFADIRLVPNGCNPASITLPVQHPLYKHLAKKSRPIIGFVGNLETKIDIPLLEKVAICFTNADILLIGSTHANPSVLRLDEYPNVYFTGVVPYDHVGAWVSLFDVALIPHLNTDLTQYMNPLKLYVYLSWNVPVVSASIPNIDVVSGMVFVSDSHDGFTQNIQNVLRKRIDYANIAEAYCRANSWEVRLKDYVDRIISVVRQASFSRHESHELSEKKASSSACITKHPHTPEPPVDEPDKAMENENKLLLEQFHLVQEQLEEYYLKYQELKNREAGI